MAGAFLEQDQLHQKTETMRRASESLKRTQQVSEETGAQLSTHHTVLMVLSSYRPNRDWNNWRSEWTKGVTASDKEQGMWLYICVGVGCIRTYVDTVFALCVVCLHHAISTCFIPPATRHRRGFEHHKIITSKDSVQVSEHFSHQPSDINIICLSC